MKLTKAQVAELADKLAHPYGQVTLMCDGYRITLQVERSAKSLITYRVLMYINGQWKGEWISGKNEHPEQKFMRKSVRPLCSPKKRLEAEKVFGKKYVKADKFFSAQMTLYYPDWANGKAALSHLCRVCESVQVAPSDA